MVKVVVTAFGAFGPHATNPSIAYVEELAKQKEELFADTSIELITETMPVDYAIVKKRVEEIWRDLKPDFVIHVGVHPRTDTVHIERRAERCEYRQPDIGGKVPADNICCVGNVTTEPFLCTQFNIASIVYACNSVDGKCSSDQRLCTINPSDDPGRYLCSYSLYSSLARGRGRALFVHVPVPNEEKGLDAKHYANVIAAVVKECAGQIAKF